MKIVRKTILASAITTAIAGCSEDYNAPSQTNDYAPEHGGDITVTAHEKDTAQLIYLLGDLDGSAPEFVNNVLSIGGGAFDRDGNPLAVTDISIRMDGNTVDDSHPLIETVNTDKVKIHPYTLADELDSGETRVIEISYSVSDLVNSTARQALITITGEDFAPVVDGDLIGNFTKDAGKGYVDLLFRTSDADGEALVATNLVADAGNPLSLPATITSDNRLEVDLAAIEDQVNDGEKLTFNYSVDIEDHNHAITRNISVNVLGVKDVPGAPLIENYFLSSSTTETGDTVVVDLSQTVIEREGDAIIAHDIMLDGSSDMPFGVEIDGNLLELDPHAFFHEIDAGQTRDFTFTFKISDDQGNTSDGERELIISVAGEETNLAVTAGLDVGFESPANLGPLTADNQYAGFSYGWSNSDCPVSAVTAAAARSGDAGLHLEGAYCHFEIANLVPTLEDDQKYIMSYWLNNIEPVASASGTPFVPLYATGALGDLNNRFWSGTRYQKLTAGQWFEHALTINTNTGGNWDGYEGLGVAFALMKYAGAGKHYLDDFSMVRYGHYNMANHDLLKGDGGTFDGGATSFMADSGTVEIRDVNGDNKLFVDTTGSDAVSVTLAVKDGAIRPGHRYILSVDAEALNDAASSYWVNLSNGSAQITSESNGSTTVGSTVTSDFLLSEEAGRSSDVDWSMEAMQATLYFPADNAQYLIDNVRLIEIP